MEILKWLGKQMNEIVATFGYMIIIILVLAYYNGRIHSYGPDLGRMLCIW